MFSLPEIVVIVVILVAAADASGMEEMAPRVDSFSKAHAINPLVH